MTERVIFGYLARKGSAAVIEPDPEKMVAFAIELGELAGLEIVPFPTSTYVELTKAVQKGKVDLAWLPPIPFIALEGREKVAPLISLHRDGQSQFHSAIIVRKSSPIRTCRELAGKRAAWVDPYSAAGYVIPRIELHALGVDPRTAFAGEKFYRSHEEVVRAVMDRRADFGASYAGLDVSGVVVRGSWFAIAGAESAIRAVYTFAAIPGDVIAAVTGMSKTTRSKVAYAFMALSGDDANRALLRELFGADEALPWSAEGYERLRVVTMGASKAGLLEALEHDAPDAPEVIPPATAEATPAEATPAEATPAEATPAEATPAEATPAAETPPEATPSEATPPEATPAEVTPPEAASPATQDPDRTSDGT